MRVISGSLSALALQASLGHGSNGTAAAGSNWSAARQQHRLSGHSCESGVASFTSSRLSYLSVASGSSHDSINRLPEDDESAYSSIVNFTELYESGYTVSEFLCSCLFWSHMCNRLQQLSFIAVLLQWLHVNLSLHILVETNLLCTSCHYDVTAFCVYNMLFCFANGW